MRYFFFALTGLFVTGVAQAEPMRMAPGQSMEGKAMPAPSQTVPHTMETMSMDQQMAVCSRIEALQKQGKTLNKTMQSQKVVCDKMGGSMTAPAQPAPDATLER